MEYNVSSMSLEIGVKAGDIYTDDGRFTQLPDIDRSIVLIFTTVLYKTPITSNCDYPYCSLCVFFCF